MVPKRVIPEDLRSRTADLHKAGTGYKAISKSLDILKSTVTQIVYKQRQFSTVAAFTRSGSPAMMTPRTQNTIVNEEKAMLQ